MTLFDELPEETSTMPVPETKKYETIVRQEHAGPWYAKTHLTRNGISWEIITNRNHFGQLTTNAQECKETTTQDGTKFTIIAPFSDTYISLITERVKATENAVKKQHAAALQIFECKSAVGELPIAEQDETIKTGQILWLNGHGQNQYHHQRQAVYEINGHLYKTVNLETYELKIHQFVQPVRKLFGFGIYFNPGEVVSIEEVNAALEIGKQRQSEKNEAKKQQEAEAEAKRLVDIDKGRQIIQTIPPWATHIIVGKLEVNDSDPQTDYFSHHTEDTIYLSWSKSYRTNFKELREAAKNSKHTEHLTTATDKFENRRHYFLGETYSGWNVKKYEIKPNTLELLQIAAANGKYFIPEKQVPMSENKELVTEKTVKINTEKNGVEIYFPSKPDETALTKLKSNGWRWSHFNKCWYNTHNEENLKFAESF
jgi:hypothetical protein